MMPEPEFKDKFVAFVDILGFKGFVKAAESGGVTSLRTLLEAANALGTTDDQRRYEQYGPRVCPGSHHIRPDLDFKLTQVSDCVVVTAEVSPSGAINVIAHCWGAVIQLLTKGMMCRGFITRGPIYHVPGQFVGSGYMTACDHEKNDVTAFKRRADERGTPFVEIDTAVCEYVTSHGDPCVKEMFKRYVATDGNVTALFPFQRLAHSFMFHDKIDAEREREANRRMRQLIENLKRGVSALVDRSNPRAVEKAEHYIAALNRQTELSARVDAWIEMLSPPPHGK